MGEREEEMVDYKSLDVWQKARMIVKEIYAISETFPPEEKYGLTSQIRRAAVSVPSNIAEGYNRHSSKDFVHFLRIAKGSAAETETQLILAKDVSLVTDEKAEPLLVEIDKLIRMISSLILARLKQMEGNR